MQTAFAIADRRLNALAERVAVWRPGTYAGGLYAAFADALAALDVLEPSHAMYCRERLERLAAPVGLVLAVTDDIAGSAPWRCAGIVKSHVDPWHMVNVLHGLFPQPSFRARVAKPGPPTVEVWTAMRPAAGRLLLRRVESALTRPSVLERVGNCWVLPLRD